MRWTKDKKEERGKVWTDWVWGRFRLLQGMSDDRSWSLIRDGKWVADFDSLAEGKTAAERMQSHEGKE